MTYAFAGSPMDDNAYVWPRLSGKLWYGPPHRWEVKRDSQGVEILPVASLRGLVLYFVSLAVLSVVAIPFLNMMPQISTWLAIGAGTGLALTFLIFAFAIKEAASREWRRGPILQIPIAEQRVRLPRIDQSWPLNRVLRWEIVYGCQLRGNRTFGDYISELQMIIEEDDGRLSVWPIIGALGRNDRHLVAAVREIAESTGLPCVMVDKKGTKLMK